MVKDYSVIYTINQKHKIYLVKSLNDNQIYVKKQLAVFNMPIYYYLLQNRIAGIPKIIDLWQEDDQLIVIEEYLPGKTLEELIKERYSFDEKTIMHILTSITETLIALNKNAQIVHRDIKPSNIILWNDKVSLIDFNAAKFVDEEHDRDTVLLGTEGYAAPEQYGFGSSTSKTDIYAIGILAKTLLNGQKASKKLTNIINKCTQLDPNFRYESLDKLLMALTSKHDYQEYLPVGFRSNNPLRIALSIALYFIVFLLIMCIETGTGDFTDTLFARIGFGVASFLVASFSGNYLNVQRYIKFSKNKTIKVLTIIGIDYLMMIVVIFAFAILEFIIFG